MSLFSFLGFGKDKGKPAEPARELPAAMYCDAGSENARAVFSAAGYRFVENPADAEILWMRKDYRPLIDQLKPFQLLNHLPNEHAVTDKGLLAEHLAEFDRHQSKYDFGIKDLVQETYRLEDPEDRERFFRQLPAEESKENLWILKPCGSSRGRGIRILWQFDELRNLYADPAKYLFDPAENRHVIQRYIRNPLLLRV